VGRFTFLVGFFFFTPFNPLWGKEGGEEVEIFLDLLINFILFSFLLFFLTRKPLREFLSYRFLSFHHQFQEMKRKREELEKRLADLKERISRMGAWREERKRQFLKEIEEEVRFIKEEFASSERKIRSIYEKRKEVLRRKARYELLSEFIKMLEEEIPRKVKNVPRDEYTRYLKGILS
jgi:F0F1-type ATP synthase membrane subunit b/b'